MNSILHGLFCFVIACSVLTQSQPRPCCCLTTDQIEQEITRSSCCAQKTPAKGSGSCDPQKCKCGLHQADTARIECTIQVQTKVEPASWNLETLPVTAQMNQNLSLLSLHQILRPDKDLKQSLATLNVWRC